MFANPITTRAETSMSASGLILTFLRLPKRFRLTSDSCSIILGFPPNPKVVRERQVQWSGVQILTLEHVSVDLERACGDQHHGQLQRWCASQRQGWFIYLLMCAHPDSVDTSVLLHSSMAKTQWVPSFITMPSETKHLHELGIFILPHWKWFQAAKTWFLNMFCFGVTFGKEYIHKKTRMFLKCWIVQKYYSLKVRSHLYSANFRGWNRLQPF